MEDGGAAPSQRPSRSPRYAGEDLSPTTTRELRGFYAYGVAAEVFAVCGVGEYLFLLLFEQEANTYYRLIPSRDFGAASSRTGSPME